MAMLFLADNAIADNSPRTISFENEDGEEVVFSISQNRSGSKPEGQDAIASHVNGRWQCVVLCDGHDVHGHLAARGICEELSLYLLEVLAAHATGNEGEELRLDDDPTAERLILQAFEETERRVMWSNAMLQPNSFVRIIDGEHVNKVGFVSEVHDLDDTFSIIVVDSDDYHRPRVPRQFLMGARFVGGATCVCFVRDSIANLCRVAVMGDTRCMVINGNAVLERDNTFEHLPDSRTFLTFPHDVYNTAELARLQAEWDGEHEIDGCYLVNPLTGCEIQPTRGFGDFDMFGTGFISVPDVSLAFPLDQGTMVILGSDGLFDLGGWKDDFQYMADFCHTRALLPEVDVASLGEMLHLESARRSDVTSGYVDDISFFMCRQVPRLGDGTALASAKRSSAATRQSMVTTTPGVEGLPNYYGAGGNGGVPGVNNGNGNNLGGYGSFILPRLSASLSEIAVNRRISHALTTHTVEGDFLLLPSSPTAGASANNANNAAASPTAAASTVSAAASPKNTSVVLAGATTTSNKHMKRHSTADFINPNAPRYIKHSMVSISKEDTIRRTRGPSFMLPDGFDISGGGLILEEERSSCGDVAMDLARIGEDAEYNDGTSPADTIRHLIQNKRKSLSPEHQQQYAQQQQSRASVHTILQRMAARYGHDPKILQEIAKDLNMV